MASSSARQIAAQCWCDKETEHLVMDPVLAEAFAKRIDDFREVIIKLMHLSSGSGALVTTRCIEADPAGNTYEMEWGDFAKRCAKLVDIDLEAYDISYFAG
jgi:hypothetical protein